VDAILNPSPTTSTRRHRRCRCCSPATWR